MSLALFLARQGIGRTAPNPSVGAVVVARDGKTIVGVGHTAAGGRPHGEPIALAMAGERAKGGTLYVTLEPCSHTGKSPPCVESIIDSGIAKVVCALGDLDERVSGRGFDILRKAGIQVITDIMSIEALTLTIGHFMRVEENRPYVLLKSAVSADGLIAAGDGDQPVWVTGPLARNRGHLERAKADAILVGIGTVLADDPDLTCRLPGMQDRSPVRIILDSTGRLPLDSRLLQTAERTPVMLFCLEKHLNKVQYRMFDTAVEVSGLPAGKNGKPDLKILLNKLAELGITRLLIEGGPHIAGSFLEANLVDQVILFQSPSRLGQNGLPAYGNKSLTFMTNDDAFLPIYKRRFGQDTLTCYQNIGWFPEDVD